MALFTSLILKIFFNISINGNGLFFYCSFNFNFQAIDEEDEENRSLLVKGDSQGDLTVVVTELVGNKRLPIDFPVIGGLNLNSGMGRLQTS
jgi:hypothetical protein